MHPDLAKLHTGAALMPDLNLTGQELAFAITLAEQLMALFRGKSVAEVNAAIQTQIDINLKWLQDHPTAVDDGA
jgi:hypothetical protein